MAYKGKWKKILLLMVVVVLGANLKGILRNFFPLEFEESIYKYSVLYDVDPNLIASVINTESKFNEDAVSSKGAIGLMQIMPDTGVWIGELMGIEGFSEKLIKEPDVNINLGTWYLNRLSDEFQGNYDLVLAAYNGGPGNVAKWLGSEEYSEDGTSLQIIPFKETKNYVKKVKINYIMYKFLYDLDKN